MKHLLLATLLTLNLLPSYSQNKKDLKVNFEDLAINAYELKDYNLAIINYTKAIKQKPNNYSLYFNRAYSYSNTNDLRNSIKDYNVVLNSSKDDNLRKKAAFNLGLNYSRLDDNTAAIDSYNNCISIARSNYDLRSIDYDAYLKLANCKFKIGDYNGSIQVASFAIGIYNKKIDGYEIRASSYYNLGQKQNSLKDKLEIEKIEPKNWVNLFSIGIDYLNEADGFYKPCVYFSKAREAFLLEKRNNGGSSGMNQFQYENLETFRSICGQDIPWYFNIVTP